MEPPPQDPAVSAALETALGHPPPFTPEECAALTGPLTIRHARDLTFLQHLTGLRQLELIASEVRRLEFLAQLGELVTLKVICTPITRLDPVVHCRKLEELELLFTSAEDMSPLLSLPALRYARLIGNPWSPKSFQEARLKLWTTATERWGRPPLTESSGRLDWETTRQLRNKGLKLGFSHLNGVQPALVKPGFGLLEGADCDAVAAQQVGVLVELGQAGVKADSLLQHFARSVPVLGASELRSRRTLGGAEQAMEWVRSSPLPAVEQERLLRFIRRFPWMTFYREGPEYLEHLAHRHQIAFPEWMRAQHAALSGVMPDCELSMQFDGYDTEPYNAEELQQGWYSLGPIGYGQSDQREMLLERCGVCPVVSWEKGWISSLAFSVSDPTDRTLYQYNEEYLSDAVSEGRDPREHLYPVFDSHASMLSHIKAVRIDGLEVIAARDLEH